MSDVGRSHPANSASLVVVHGSPENDGLWQTAVGAIDFILRSLIDPSEAIFPADRFGLERCRLAEQSTFVFLCPPSRSRIAQWAEALAGHWAVSRRGPTQSTWPSTDVVPVNACVSMRLPQAELVDTLRSLHEVFDLLDLVPSLEIDLPFALIPDPLDEIFPVLALLLRHPSLPAGRNFILNKTGRAKEIVFGVHDREDAMALQLMVTALGPLQVEVRIKVLDM